MITTGLEAKIYSDVSIDNDMRKEKRIITLVLRPIKMNK